MRTVHCHLPIRLVLTGRPTDGQLGELRERLAEALLRRLALAERHLAGRVEHRPAPLPAVPGSAPAGGAAAEVPGDPGPMQVPGDPGTAAAAQVPGASGSGAAQVPGASGSGAEVPTEMLPAEVPGDSGAGAWEGAWEVPGDPGAGFPATAAPGPERPRIPDPAADGVAAGGPRTLGDDARSPSGRTQDGGWGALPGEDGMRPSGSSRTPGSDGPLAREGGEPAAPPPSLPPAAAPARADSAAETGRFDALFRYTPLGTPTGKELLRSLGVRAGELAAAEARAGTFRRCEPDSRLGRWQDGAFVCGETAFWPAEPLVVLAPAEEVAASLFAGAPDEDHRLLVQVTLISAFLEERARRASAAAHLARLPESERQALAYKAYRAPVETADAERLAAHLGPALFYRAILELGRSLPGAGGWSPAQARYLEEAAGRHAREAAPGLLGDGDGTAV